jgi:SAM-dependent methyltransferase
VTIGPRGGQALVRFIASLSTRDRVLDVGSGEGEHARRMRAAGLEVTTLDIAGDPDVRAAYLDHRFEDGTWDGLWSSHVLEHQQDAGAFLRKCRREVKVGGVVGITVPPMKPNLVGGHLTLWTEGLLAYNMVLAGFDLSKARVGVYDYDISILTRNAPATLPTNLAHDHGDLERLTHLFPTHVRQNMDGRFGNIRW